MSTVDEQTATMIANYPAKTGRPLGEWVELIRSAGPAKHGEVVAWLKTEHGMSHGFANYAAMTALKPDDAPAGDELVDAMYTGSKAVLRPLHDAAMAEVTGFGPDVEIAPKKAYVSLRRSKQFATVGPGPGGRLEIGLNLRDAEAGGRLESVTNGMCSHRVRIASAADLDDELRGWLREAYDRA
jgi:predicted transport protein